MEIVGGIPWPNIFIVIKVIFLGLKALKLTMQSFLVLWMILLVILKMAVVI